jgi:hypothetical protein
MHAGSSAPVTPAAVEVDLVAQVHTVRSGSRLAFAHGRAAPFADNVVVQRVTAESYRPGSWYYSR